MNKKSLIEYFKIKHAEGGSLMRTEGELSEAIDLQSILKGEQSSMPKAIHTNENIMPKADAESRSLIYLRSINENSSFEEVFEKITGKSYNNYLKKLEKIKKKEAKIEYEKKIPQRKLNLKKSNIKVIQGVFQEELNKQHMIIKCKPGKRIIILNIWVREKLESLTSLQVPDYIKLSKDINENIYAYYSKEPPYDFEIEYFFLKAEQHKLKLKVLEDVNLMAKNLSPKVEEVYSRAVKLTPEIKKKLS